MKIVKLSLAVVMASSALFAQNSVEKELQELRQMSLKILKRIEVLESQQKSATQSAKPVVAQPEKSAPKAVDSIASHTSPREGKGIVELSSDATTMTLGGRIQFDTWVSDPDRAFKASWTSDTPGNDKHFGASARQSRLWVKTRTTTDVGVLRSLIEMDFFSGSGNEINTNSHAPRLRNAYVTLNGFTVGQTYSLFTTVHTPDIIVDPVNETYARQPLIALGNTDPNWRYDLSLELPETTLTDPDGKRVTPGDDQLPDFAARLRYYAEWGEVGAALLLRQIRQDHATISSGGSVTLTNSDEAFAWGVNSSAKIPVFGRDDLRFGFQYGKGIGRYLAENAYNAGTVDTNGKITLQDFYGAHIAYRHWWSEKLRSTLAYNITGVDNNTNVAPMTVGKEAQSGHVNLIWAPISNGLVGIEYAHLDNENEQGDEGNIDIVQMRFRYEF